MNRSLKDIFFVSVQLILFIVYLFRISNIDFSIGPVWQYLALGLAVAGLITVPLAIFTLNKSLSVFPTPKRSAVLVQNGIYRFMRHPIYTGVLLFALGFSVYSENTLRLIVFFALFVLFAFKASYEEDLLLKRFPGYKDYMKTSGMFLPGI